MCQKHYISVHPLESVTEDDVDRAGRIDENHGDLEISYHEIDHEWIAVGMVDPASLFFIESDCSFREVTGHGPGQRICARLGLALISFGGRDGIAAKLRPSDDHVHSAVTIVVALFVLSSAALFSQLVPLERVLCRRALSFL